MKYQLLVTALLTATFLSSGAAAASEPSTVTPAPELIRPVPVKVVQPTGLPTRFKEATVKLTFTIDEHGNLHDVAPVGRMPDDLAKRLLSAVAQWKFTPMYENGRPVPVRVIFPLQITAGS